VKDDLDVLLRACVKAEAPDWLEPLVTERAVARVEKEAATSGTMALDVASILAMSRRLRDGVAAVARGVRREVRARRSIPGDAWARLRAAVQRPRSPSLRLSASTKAR
jgi:hypothetical protein